MNTGSIGISADPYTDSRSLPPNQLGHASTSCPSSVKAISPVGVTAPVVPSMPVMTFGGHGRGGPEELAGLAVERAHDARLAGAGHDPPCLVVREPRVDPAHGGAVGGHRVVDEQPLERVVEVPEVVQVLMATRFLQITHNKGFRMNRLAVVPPFHPSF